MCADDAASPARFVRVGTATGPGFDIFLDGALVPARPGDSLLACLLAAGGKLRRSEITGDDRAGYCLMGACQDCWVWLEDGRRLRACTTPAEPGMRICSQAPPSWHLPTAGAG